MQYSSSSNLQIAVQPYHKDELKMASGVSKTNEV